MDLPVWFVNAFASERFHGNPAAVIATATELPVDLMRAIAAENRLSETAFVVPVSNGRYSVRWFTPRVEVPLCGHATLASAWVVFNRLAPQLRKVSFDSHSGPLHVERQEKRLVLDLPASELGRPEASGELTIAFGAEPLEVYSGGQWLVRYADEAAIRSLKPNFGWLEATGVHGFIVTAPGDSCDFVSRFFAPKVGVPEDPVTGSAHTYLVPYWAKRLHKTRLTARQVSDRGGELWCDLAGDRVRIAGEACLYLEGKIQV